MNASYATDPSRRPLSAGEGVTSTVASGAKRQSDTATPVPASLDELSRQTLDVAIAELAQLESALAEPVTSRLALRTRVAAIAGRAAHPQRTRSVHPATWRLYEAQRARRVALAYLDHRVAVCRNLERQALERLRDELQLAYTRGQERLATNHKPDESAALTAPVVDALRRSLRRDLAIASGAVLHAWRTVEQEEGPGRWARFCASHLRLEWLDAVARLDGLLRLPGLPSRESEDLAATLHPRLAVTREARESLQDIECLIDEVRTRMDMTPLRLLSDSSSDAPATGGSADERPAMASTLRDLQVRRLDWRERLYASLDPDGLAAFHEALVASCEANGLASNEDTIADEIVRAWRLENPLVLPDRTHLQPSMAASER